MVHLSTPGSYGLVFSLGRPPWRLQRPTDLACRNGQWRTRFWSPDGDRIVFQSPAEPADDQHPQQIYTIRPDGTYLRQITHYAVIPGFTIGTFGARWSPDGRKLVFADRDPNTTLGPDGQPHSDLFEMNPDGSDVVQITFTPEKDNDPAWGPRR